MENKKRNENKWQYVNDFYYCKDNIKKETIDYYIDAISHLDPESFEKYLKTLKMQYNTVNYLYILETMINYTITVFNLTYKDYCIHKKDRYIGNVLNNISDKYATLKFIYMTECEENRIRQEEYKNKQKYKLF